MQIVASKPSIEIIGPKSCTYNCFAYALGITNEWIIPGLHINDYKRIIRERRQHNNKIAIFGFSMFYVEHAAVQCEKTKRWISKCGSEVLVRHNLEDFFNTEYGVLLEIIE